LFLPCSPRTNPGCTPHSLSLSHTHTLSPQNEAKKPQTALVKKVKKARSKSIEKRGPQIHDGESQYQYLMRKKREEAYEEELRKEEAREEQARLREEKILEDMEYRQRLNDEYEANQREYDDE